MTVTVEPLGATTVVAIRSCVLIVASVLTAKVKLVATFAALGKEIVAASAGTGGALAICANDRLTTSTPAVILNPKSTARRCAASRSSSPSTLLAAIGSGLWNENEVSSSAAIGISRSGASAAKRYDNAAGRKPTKPNSLAKRRS